MADDNDTGLSDDLKKTFDELFGELTRRHHESLKEYLDLHRVVVEDYGRYVDDELNHDNKVLRHLAQIMSEQTGLALRAHRTHRENVKEIHGRVIDAHLKFIDHLRNQLDGPKRAKPSAAKSPQAPPEPSTEPPTPPKPTRPAPQPYLSRRRPRVKGRAR